MVLIHFFRFGQSDWLFVNCTHHFLTEHALFLPIPSFERKHGEILTEGIEIFMAALYGCLPLRPIRTSPLKLTTPFATNGEHP